MLRLDAAEIFKFGMQKLEIFLKIRISALQLIKKKFRNTMPIIDGRKREKSVGDLLGFWCFVSIKNVSKNVSTKQILSTTFLRKTDASMEWRRYAINVGQHKCNEIIVEKTELISTCARICVG